MQKAKSYRNLIWGCCMTGIAMFFAFFFLYHTYIQDIIYEERLNQMEEITRQMFQNLEDVIDSHWDRVTEECNYLRDANIQTTDELCRHMKKKYELSAYADHKITLMAVDSEGGYYTESGKRGLFRDLDYFEESPEKTSFVFDSMTDNQSKMVFLNRLPEPIYLQNGEKKTSILYFGIAQDMEQLNPYFNCEAYNGNNSVYVLDDNGSKLFNSNQVELIKGHNVFSVLQNMKYLHNSSFEKTKAELEEKGCSYSNAVLISITSLIRYDAGDKGKVIEYADKIDTSSQHLLGIINEVLDMSKIEAGKTVFKYSDFSIPDFIQELDTIFRSQIYEKKQTLTITKENIRHEWVNGDQVHLMQIFSNLLSNAIKYTQEGGEIQLLAEECESNSSVYAKYRFLVCDNGMGMSADFKDRIFDAFTRAENSLTNKIQGTGLGMAITKNLVDLMGGTIDVESEPGQGSCFEVFMDLKIAEERSASPASQAETEEQDGNILKGMRFLCAEDNELNAEILTELLKIEGAECTICENGKRALETFEQSVPGDYDMILMDIQMPVMNGYEATKAIRRSSHELAKTIPIIAMTANAFSEDIQHSLTAGMNAHISKPVDMMLLEKTIRSIKSGGGSETQADKE